MPTWTAPAGGEWTTSGNWSGGIPDAVNAVASFFDDTDGLVDAVTIIEGNTIDLGTMNVTLDGTTSLVIRGSLADSGSGVATLSFNQNDLSDNPARVNIDTNPGGGIFEISSFGGLRVQLASDTEFNVVNFGSTAQINAPIIGTGTLYKLGAGNLSLSSPASTFSGGISIDAGTVIAVSADALGTGTIRFIGTSGTLRASGTVDNVIGTQINAAGSSGQVVAPTGTTLTLTGSLGNTSGGILTLGNVSDNGTIALNLVSGQLSTGTTRLSGATIRFENSYVASSLFSFSANAQLELVNNAVLDTRGFTTHLRNVDFDAGTIRSTTGTLNLTISDTLTVANAQTGTIQGTAGDDIVTINATNNYSLAGMTFANWSATDDINLNGSASINNLTGSAAAERISGLGGNDILAGGGGTDRLVGGDGDDLLILNSANNNSAIEGGTGTDTLRITGGTIDLTFLDSIEGIELQNGATLRLTSSQFTDVSSNALISGNGTIEFALFGGQMFLASALTVAAGSTLTFDITGSGTSDVIKSVLGVSHIIHSSDGADQVRAGNLVDTIDGGNGADKIMGLGGADILTGGADADQFRYLFSNDSGTGAGADQILDFLSGTDKLDFRVLDANPNVAGRQALSFVGTGNFSATGNAEVRWADLGADLRVYVDLDGNGTSDMEMLLVGAGNQTLQASDFMF